MFIVEHIGSQVLVEDLGRPGWAASGVSDSGVADRTSAALALRAVGCSQTAAVLEILVGGIEIRTDSPAVIAITGALAPVTVTTKRGRHYRAGRDVIHLAVGDRVAVGPATTGLRTYLAVRGGFAVPPVLHSRSYDSLSGMGPPPLRVGDTLAVGTDYQGPWSPGWYCALTPPDYRLPAPTETAVLDVWPGPRDDEFDDHAWQLLAQPSTVQADSNRVGVRMHATEPITRRHAQEMPSEGMVRGAIQIPPDGHPVLFGPDHPVTGGYPVIGVLTDRSVDVAMQLRPGARVVLKRVTL